jgi:hypothetical protein
MKGEQSEVDSARIKTCNGGEMKFKGLNGNKEFAIQGEENDLSISDYTQVSSRVPLAAAR